MMKNDDCLRALARHVTDEDSIDTADLGVLESRVLGLLGDRA